MFEPFHIFPSGETLSGTFGRLEPLSPVPFSIRSFKDVFQKAWRFSQKGRLFFEKGGFYLCVFSSGGFSKKVPEGSRRGGDACSLAGEPEGIFLDLLS